MFTAIIFSLYVGGTQLFWAQNVCERDWRKQLKLKAITITHKRNIMPCNVHQNPCSRKQSSDLKPHLYLLLALLNALPLNVSCYA